MIKSIELKNVQSHEDTRVEFDKGINCIVGSSNNGKSAILRGLYWVKYNRPLGTDSLASHWALNDKGELKSPMSVTVVNDNGTVTRRRTKNENQYIVNGEVLNVVKSDVPDVVERTLRLSDTNIQRQLDAPFLLSSTSGEVAKYFNKIVRLDIIDKVLTNAESIRRKTKGEIERTESQIKDCEEKLESFKWLEIAEIILNKYERVEKKNSELKEGLESLKKSFLKYEESLEVVSRNDFSREKRLVEAIERLHFERDCLEVKIHNASNDVEYMGSVKAYPDFKKERVMIERLLDYEPDRTVVERLIEEVDSYENLKSKVKNCDGKAAELRGQLPDVCPLCNRSMRECEGD